MIFSFLINTSKVSIFYVCAKFFDKKVRLTLMTEPKS